jgi:DNA-binding NtrC family response regulator
VDVRVIAATHVDLAAAVRNGEFREDLYYRLNVVPIELPPLRERRADICPLAEHFLAAFARQYRLPRPTISRDASAALVAYDWPGNVRELRNAMERALLLSSTTILRATDIVLNPPARSRARGETLPFPATAHELLRAAARRMVELSAGNKSEAARRFGISRARLLRLLNTTLDDDAQPLAGAPPAGESLEDIL